jgi:RIO-like serine/threonine protein kinase
MNIDAEIIKQLGIFEYHEERRFFSRRNEVYLFCGKLPDGKQIQFVYKKFVQGNKENEYTALTALKGGRFPHILACGNDAICLEYIKGQTMLECLEESERSGETCSGFINELLYFLQGFYESMPGFVYGDVNLRNFIVAESGIYGVDLEETHPGRPEIDIGRAMAFILTYYPVTQYKKEAAEYLIRSASERLDLSIGEMENQKEKELSDMLIRRGGRR